MWRNSFYMKPLSSNTSIKAREKREIKTLKKKADRIPSVNLHEKRSFPGFSIVDRPIILGACWDT